MLHTLNVNMIFVDSPVNITCGLSLLCIVCLCFQEIEELAGVDANEFDNFLAGKKVPAIQGEGLHSKWLENLQKRLNSRNEVRIRRCELHTHSISG